MPDITPSPSNPYELQIQQQAIERQRMLATLLQKDSMTPEQGQMISGHYVAPSWTQMLSKLANGAIGSYQQSSLDDKQMGLARQYNDNQQALARALIDGPSSTSSASAAPQTASPSPQTAGPAALQVSNDPTGSQSTPNPSEVPPQRLAKALQVTGADAYTGGGNPGPASAPQSGGNPLFRGMSPQVLANFIQNPDGAFGKIATMQMQANAKGMEPTDVMKSMRAAGIPEGSPQWNQALQDVVKKSGYIADTPIRPGSFVKSPDGSMKQVPAVPEGYQAVGDGAGGWKIVPVQGGMEAITATAGAKAAGQAAYQPERVWNAATGQYEYQTKANIANAVNGTPGQAQAPRFVGQDLLEQLPANVRAGILNDAKSGNGQFKLNYQMPDGRRISGTIDLNTAAGTAAPGSAGASKSGAFAAEPAPGMAAGANVMGESNAKAYQELKTQAAGAADRISALDHIYELANGATQYGPGTTARLEKLATINSMLPPGMALGNDDVKNAQIMQKYVSNLAGQYMKALGGTGTDAQLSNSLKSMANPDMMNEAMKKVIPTLKALDAAVQAKANGYDAWLAQGNTVDKGNLYESQFRNAYDPRVFQVMQMEPQQRAAFVKSMPAPEYATFTKKYQALKQLQALPQ